MTDPVLFPLVALALVGLLVTGGCWLWDRIHAANVRHSRQLDRGMSDSDVDRALYPWRTWR